MPKKKNRAAVALGRRGGQARAAKLSAEERQEIAKKAAAARWTRDTRASMSGEEGKKYG